ncbi:MAG TPA: hypothetical protein VFD72_06780 [Sphingobacteriaceae bacterium]|nr:hypothetical protein [Sphingobacteriaceae bacterium]
MNTFTRYLKMTLIAALLLGSPALIFAQSSSEYYTHAVGGRFGVSNGITYKHFLSPGGHAIDAIVNFQGNREYGVFKVLGLYEIHDRIQVLDYQGLLWYYGAGGGLGIYDDKLENSTTVAFSIDGVVGVDFKIPTAPINIALDWKPMLELSPYPGLKFDGFGLSLRFAF